MSHTPPSSWISKNNMADYADLLAAENNKKPEPKPASPGTPAAAKQDTRPATKTPRQTDVRHDVTPSPRHDVNHRAWRDIIENTETLNSALRLTREERYEVEDMIQDLERKHKIKTSMNEVARLGLLLVIHDYKTNKQQSLLYKVKKS
jgi:hypothetical protein